MILFLFGYLSPSFRSMNSGSLRTKKWEELSFHVHHPAAFDPKGDDTPKLLICALIACSYPRRI
ncbi:unnamed protein product [Linum tenue]|uniref:Uncharacterized protein n=1 Tax=Linum tenue TaxID=586396 RepID=A0AAV0HQF0_9ROSI|nr:unnamed protein product [Linum tenue]